MTLINPFLTTCVLWKINAVKWGQENLKKQNEKKKLNKMISLKQRNYIIKYDNGDVINKKQSKSLPAVQIYWIFSVSGNQ